MDLNYSTEELAFRDEIRGWLRENLPGRSAPEGRELRVPVEGRFARLASHARGEGLGRARVAGRMGRDDGGAWSSAISSRRNAAMPLHRP